MAHRLRGGKPGARRGAGEGEDQRGQRGLPGHPGGRHRGVAIRGKGHGRHPQDVPGAQGRSSPWAARPWAGSGDAPGHLLRLDPRPEGVHVGLVLRAPAHEDGDRHDAGKRVRSERRRIRPHGVDERERADTGSSRQDAEGRILKGVPAGEVLLLLGSNVGQREKRLREGLALLSRKVEVVRVSRVYASEPWGKTDQRWFLNVAVRGICPLSPDGLLAFAKEVEAAAGRKERERWGPRELDVDNRSFDGRAAGEQYDLGSSQGVQGSARGASDMRQWHMGPYPLRKAVALCVLALFLVSPAACRRKQETPPPPGEAETINLNAISQIENYKEILRKDPNNLQALINIANLYFDTRQDLPAIEHYRKALALDPRNVNVRTDMAVCFRRSGNPDRAVEELKKAISIDPRHAQSRYNLGIILIHDKGDIEGGIRAWEALLENVPNYQYRDSLKGEIERMRGMSGSAKPKYK
ncbi:MAG: 2-amino-4-hydroxy-6-hydroxymethyldihydropteridine diphosphokinase [Deltaproteobacteria bacterium]|nr:2-amino-4-hydroxy-6-hydroxymethyldihydropteridine diphosphokinase [Deltaproteobacteria bacterium]